ncbi:MAG: acyl carrier protein [Gemmatimonadaceae bacterium]
MDSIVETLRTYIHEEFVPDMNIEELTATTPLMQSGILDSLAAIALGQFIEEKFNVTIDPHEVNADNFGTLDQIATFIRAKQSQAAV